MSPEEILALSSINPEFEEILRNAPPAQPLSASTDLTALRARLKAIKNAMLAANTSTTPDDVNPVREQDRQITMRDGASITIRIYTPQPAAAPTDGSPVLVMYHGGGFCLGDVESEALLCRKWVAECEGVSVNVEYRLAPEHAFPVGVNDAFDALKWTAAHMDEIGGNPEKGFVCGGVSAGANFAAGVSHLFRDEKVMPPLTGLYLSIPVLLGPGSVPEKYKARYLSREQNKDAPLLHGGIVDLFESTYKGDQTSPLTWPLLWPTGHAELPPTYFQICGMDPLRDEGLIYEQTLREEYGVKTRMDIYPGLPHGFWSWYPKAAFSKQHLIDTMNGMKWLLEQKSRK